MNDAVDGGLITDIHDAVTIGTTLFHHWFRGHADKDWELVPGIFRKDKRERDEREKDEQQRETESHSKRPKETTLEQDFLMNFIRTAPVLEHDVPKEKDHLEWLFLAQQHGTPTRLLDWSSSILVALYFAVYEEKHADKDGMLWAMYPWALNNASTHNLLPAGKEYASLPMQWCPELGSLAREAFGDCPDNPPLKETSFCELPKGPIPFKPLRRFRRLAAQRSGFTIHPKPKPDNGCDFRKLLRTPGELIRYVIPRDCKGPLEKDLAALGVEHHTLFPDLASLSIAIETRSVRDGGLTEKYKDGCPQNFRIPPSTPEPHTSKHRTVPVTPLLVPL